MPNLAPAASPTLALDGTNLVLVYAVLVIALIALAMGVVFRRQVLVADPGTENMQTIGAAVEEGAQAYLARQFKTLGIFVVLVFGLLFLLPADTDGVRGRPVPLLHRRRRLLRRHRLFRDVARGQGQRPGRLRRPPG